MKKRTKTLVIAVAVLVVLVALMVVLLLTQKEPESTEEPTSSAEVFALIEENVDNFQSLEVTNAAGTYVMTAEKGEEETTYGIAELAGFTPKTTNYTYAVETLSALNAATKVFDTVEDLETYGLKDPAAVATVSFEGNKYVLHLGNMIPQETGYYLMVEGDDALYAVASQVGELLQRGKFYYLDTEFTKSYSNSSEDAPEIKKITVERKDLDAPIILERLRSTDEGSADYLSDITFTSPIECNMSFDVTAAYIDTLFGMSAHRVEAIYHEEDAAKYGFDDPEYTLEMIYQGGRCRVVVGSEMPAEETDGEGTEYHYALCDDDGLVYRFDLNKIALATANLDDLISKIPLVPILEKIEQVDLTLNGVTHTFMVDMEVIDDDQVFTITRDGNEVDTANFKLFYQLLVAPSVEKVNTDPVTGVSTEMKVVYHYNNGKADDVIVAQEVANRRMRVTVNGKAQFEGRAAYLDELINEYQNLLDGKTVTVDW